MSIEELLSPRYKVIADYPGNVQPVGHIHEVVGDTASVIYWCMNKEKYPHLFRKLEWWEDRTPEEMPEYLKSVSGLEVYQRVFRIDGAQVAMVRFPNGKFGNGTVGPIGLLNLLPATEQEYLEYINSKNK